MDKIVLIFLYRIDAATFIFIARFFFALLFGYRARFSVLAIDFLFYG